MRALVVVLAIGGSLIAQDRKTEEPSKEEIERIRDQTTKDAAKSVSALALGSICLYCVVGIAPGLIAALRGHPDQVAIALVGLLLGFTCVGWIVALVWSCKGFQRRDGRYR